MSNDISDYTITGWNKTITIDTSDYYLDTSNISGTTNYPQVKIDDSGIEIAESADLQIGDRSLKEFMSKVEERLNILRPNSELESRWNDLSELGKQYRKLEAEILEKEKMWKILKDE